MSQLQQLIARPGESGGVLTRTEFTVSKLCTKEKLKKRTSDRLLAMLKRRDFVIEDIRAETIRELETLISDCSKSKISEYDLWTQGDGKQEVKVYLRSLKQIVEGILADLGFKNLQYLWFEYREVNGERVFGPANGAIWWQITVRKIGSGHVLIALVIFQDGSWVKMKCSISVQERHARLTKARQVSGRKRDARKDQLADRRARRRSILQDGA